MPADARLIEARDLYADEALLTGEFYPADNEMLFHTGWFVESLSTQILVIFIIRTARPLRDRPHWALVASSFVSPSLWRWRCPIGRLAHWFGLVPLSAELMGALAIVTIAYLVSVYGLKRWFFLRAII